MWWDPELAAQIALLGRGVPGDGVIDFTALTGLVRDAGYTGDVECEVFRQEIWDAPFLHVETRARDAYVAHVEPHL